MSFRIRAFLTHLLLSLTIAIITAYIVFMVWHPAPLAKAVGVSDIFLMMLGIDVILGPLLTLIIAKKGKKSLKFDLTVIAIVQIIALAYGVYNIATNRPVYIAYDTGRFDLVQVSDIPKSSLEKADPVYQSPSWTGVDYVAVKKITDDADRTERLQTELGTGVSPAMRPELYEPLENQNELYANASPLHELNQHNNPDTVTAILAKYPQADGWYGLMAFNMEMVVLIDSKNKQIVKIVDLRPW